MESKISKCGFVAVLGRPNAGKSTFLNTLLNQNLALVSHKANATRKRQNLILSTENDKEKVQIVFVDTPGLHKEEKLLNQYMLDQALKALGDCDLAVFIAPISDDIKIYKEFLDKCDKPHFVLLSKADSVDRAYLMEQIAKYENLSDKYLALVPISVKKGFKKSAEILVEKISCHLPISAFLYDEESATDNTMRDIAKEMIRESVFENLSDEIPYESDVVLEKYESSEQIDKIYAKIIVEKPNQKAMTIGKGGESIKRIGINARKKIQDIVQKKVFLKLNVEVVKGWSKKAENLKKIGYDFEI